MDRFLQSVADIAMRASETILAVKMGGFSVAHKEDASPVTEADMASHRVIIDGLRALAPEVPVVSEENEVHPALGARWWCVDPLDGTRSFARGEGEFTVNIALMEGDAPVLGVIACPLDGSCYAGAAGHGAWRKRQDGEWEPIAVSGGAGKRAIVGSHYLSKRMKILLEALRVTQVRAMSSARKFCVVAEGGVDVYPRFARTFEWDTAAGQALIEAAGGRMETLEGAPFRYGKPTFENGGFIVWGALERPAFTRPV